MTRVLVDFYFYLFQQYHPGPISINNRNIHKAAKDNLKNKQCL